MDKISGKLLEMWLKIPRWFRLFILQAITIYVICIALFKGVEVLFNLGGSIGLKELFICLLASLVILLIFKKLPKKK
ncbi:hypothetical protein AB0764_07395 [Priestia megaterium]|uniref:hypothetical protein n=1 Tax=Priestia megaterium TaxID=1404 RepID=UPI003877EFE6